MFTMLIYSGVELKAGEKFGNGGDRCEQRFLEIQSDIQNWILKGGSSYLDLPENISEQEYNSGMLDAISDVTVSCTEKAVIVNDVEKTCKNQRGRRGSKILCNFDRFLNTVPESQYSLVHHELAGIAGFEVNDGKINSDYTISNQLSAFLDIIEVKKLAVRKKNEVKIPKNIKSVPSFTEMENLYRSASLPSISEIKDKVYVGKCRLSGDSINVYGSAILVVSSTYTGVPPNYEERVNFVPLMYEQNFFKRTEYERNTNEARNGYDFLLSAKELDYYQSQKMTQYLRPRYIGPASVQNNSLDQIISTPKYNNYNQFLGFRDLTSSIRQLSSGEIIYQHLDESSVYCYFFAESLWTIRL